MFLKNRPGRSSIIKDEETKEILSHLEKPQKGGRDHWTLTSLHGYLKNKNLTYLIRSGSLALPFTAGKKVSPPLLGHSWPFHSISS